MNRHQFRNDVMKRANELMRQHPSLDRASAVSRALFEIDGVSKAGEPTLAEYIDLKLAAMTHTGIAKGQGDTWIAAKAEVMKANRDLLDVRCCGVASLPFSQAADMLRTSLRNETDYGDRQTLQRWVKALDAIAPAAPVIPRPASDTRRPAAPRRRGR